VKSLAEIDADIAVTVEALARLRDERADAVARQREAIIKAFDDGATQKQLREGYGLTEQALRDILRRAGRSERQRIKANLTLKERERYQVLLRRGVPFRTAADIAKELHS
jgi:hypothetical protein